MICFWVKGYEFDQQGMLTTVYYAIISLEFPEILMSKSYMLPLIECV